MDIAEHPKKIVLRYIRYRWIPDYLYVKVGEEKCNRYGTGHIGTKDVYFFGQKDEAKILV